MSDDVFVVLHGSSSDLVWFLSELQHEAAEVQVGEGLPPGARVTGDVWLTVLIGFGTGVAANVATDELKKFVADFNRRRSHRTMTRIEVVEERPQNLREYDSWGSE